MGKLAPDLSRRGLLGVFTAAPVAVSAPWHAAIAALPYDDEPILLGRSAQGRSESRFRYHNAESFFLSLTDAIVLPLADKLYQTGIVLQLGLSSHLLDVGFTDRWCARNIGLDVAKSLAYANATGLGFEAAEFVRLATLISPYGRWRSPQAPECHLPFAPESMRALSRDLLDHVHQVTGHPRPRGWGKRHVR